MNFRLQSEEAAASTRLWTLKDSSATDSQSDHLSTIHPLPLRRRDALHDLDHGLPLLSDDGPLRELGGNLTE